MNWAQLIGLLVMTLVFKTVEVARQFKKPNPGAGYLQSNLDLFYNLGNVNLPLSMGSVGIASGGGAPNGVVMAMMTLALVGCLSRGALSDHQPQTASWHDPDWRFGVIVPNMAGSSVFLLSLLSLAPWIAILERVVKLWQGVN